MSCFRQMDADEKAVVSFKTEGEKVRVTATVKHQKETGMRFEWIYEMDFSKVEKADLLPLAARTLHIRLQDRFRLACKTKAPHLVAADPARAFEKFDAQAILEQERKSADPIAQTFGRARKLTATDKAALIAELQAQLQSETEDE